MPNNGSSKQNSDDFSSENVERDRTPKKNRENSAKKKMEKINKEVSKDKRDDFKQEVSKKKRRRRRPRKKKENVEQKPEELKEAQKPQDEDVFKPEAVEEPEVAEESVVEEPLKPDEVPPEMPEAPVEAVNPFEAQDDSALPTPDHEERFQKNEELDEEQPEEVAETVVEDVEQTPINPFEAEPPVSTIEKKALDDKPLDRKDQHVETEKPEQTEAPTPETVEHSVEEVDQNSEQMSEQGAANEAEAADVAEQAKEQAVVAEVVEAKPEQPLEGVVQPADGDEAPDPGEEADELKEELWDILAQAGITKKKLITILLIIVFGVLFLWFGGLKLFGIGDEGGVKEVVEESDGGGEILLATTREGDVSGIVSSYVFGLEFEVPKTPILAVPIGKSGAMAGVDAALYFGEGESNFENRYIYYVDLLRKMDSIYSTDVYSLIDLAVDRRAALTEHINELDAIIQEADNVYYEIRSRLDGFDKEYEVLAIERETLEEQYFVATEELMPRSSNDYLESFIDVQHDSNELKAYYNAYRIVLDYLIAYLDLLEPRYQDIVANTEAIVKGIRVFDVPASDIDAILSIEGEL